MRIISMPPIYAFAAKYPPAVAPLNNWCSRIRKANCMNFNELRNEVSGSVDSVGNDMYIFNIGGNNYRLVAGIHFNKQIVYIRA
ncbi:MAG TPA: type II toxin-antitoxin system HigB family toxin, partial [Chitinophaga sp.]|uniref:type II toxin-antitoxin system HigB family toxin n=1 Tax=Chitinophaga sp. TaxID=1869181 RepID=UPI002F9371E0